MLTLSMLSILMFVCVCVCVCIFVDGPYAPAYTVMYEQSAMLACPTPTAVAAAASVANDVRITPADEQYYPKVAIKVVQVIVCVCNSCGTTSSKNGSNLERKLVNM